MGIYTAVRCWLGVGDMGCQPEMISLTVGTPWTIEATVPMDFAEAARRYYQDSGEWVVILLHEGSEKEFRRSGRGQMVPTDHRDRIKVVVG